MSIKYALYENHMTSDPDDFIAVPQGDEFVELSDIVRNIKESMPEISEDEIEKVLMAFFKSTSNYLKDGIRVNTPLVNLFVKMRGIYNHKNEVFTRGRHQALFGISGGMMLKNLSHDLLFEKVSADDPKPNPDTFMDLTTNYLNEVLTPSGMGILTGSRLKIDTKDEHQGIYFVSAHGNETKVRNISKNKPGELMFQIPIMDSGEYTMDVRAMIPGSGEIKEGTLDYDLTVA